MLVAIGDFGRRSLFPYSEIDLLFLLAAQDTEEKCDGRASSNFRKECRAVGLKVNATIRSFSEFSQFDSENAESILSLLDSRFLAGDQELFSNLRDRLIPEVMARESQVLVERLAEMTRNRHRKFANTVFHLEPNVKDGPGGYRDYTLACWLAAMSAMEKQHGWPDPDTLFSPAVQNTMDQALSFLASVRCFLHFRHGRDDNILTWDAQNEAAAQKIGASDTDIHSCHRVDANLLCGMPARWTGFPANFLRKCPRPRSLFYRQLETWRTGFSDADFSVVDGLIFFQTPENLSDPDLCFPHFSPDRATRFQAQPDGGAPIGAGEAVAGGPAASGKRISGAFFRKYCRSCTRRTLCAPCTPFIC